MSSSLPIVKFITLAIRQLSQPLANRIKDRAKKSVTFRTYVCMPPAQFYHWMDGNIKRKLFSFGKRTTKKQYEKLNEKAAIELGAELLGETIIFTIATITITLEFMRQQRKADREAKAIEDRWNESTQKISQLSNQINETKENFDRVMKLIEEKGRSKQMDAALFSVLNDYNS